MPANISADIAQLLAKAEGQLFVMTQCFKFEECGYSRAYAWDLMLEIREVLRSQSMKGANDEM